MPHHDHEEKHEHHHHHDHDHEAKGPTGPTGPTGPAGPATALTASGSYTGDGNASQLVVTGLPTPPKGIAILGGLATGFAYAFADGASSGPTGPCITLSGNNFNVLNSGSPSPNNVGQAYHWVAWI